MVGRYSVIIFFLLANICSFSQQAVYTSHHFKPDRTHDFSFVHLTDTHIGEGQNGDYGTKGWLDEPPIGDIGHSADRLKKTVIWINTHADSLKIKFVIVSGDITDSGERSEFMKFKEIMDKLTIPYIPLIGNHDVWPYTRYDEAETPCGDSLMNVIFAEHYKKLSTIFSSWDNGTRLNNLLNPETKSHNYLQNYSFSYEGYTFLMTDFGTRKHAEPGELGVGPQADLHNFPGGTFPWLQAQLASNKTGNENVFLFSHWPLTKDPLVNVHVSSMTFGFSEYQQLARMLYSYRNILAIWFSGHIHRDRIQTITRNGETEEIALCVETAANKKFENGHVRIVKVWR